MADALQTPDETIHLKVKSQVREHLTKDNEEVYFKIKRTTQLKKLMDKYCERQQVSAFLNIDSKPSTCQVFV